jgi:hypothetical protein
VEGVRFGGISKKCNREKEPSLDEKVRSWLFVVGCSLQKERGQGVKTSDQSSVISETKAKSVGHGEKNSKE